METSISFFFKITCMLWGPSYNSLTITKSFTTKQLKIIEEFKCEISHLGKDNIDVHLTQLLAFLL